MHSDSPARSHAKPARNGSRAKLSNPQTLSDSLWDILVRRMLKKTKSIPLVLGTWEASMEGSAKLLHLLTEKMPLEWWLKQKAWLRKEILDELMRIDNGRGIIADWLAVIIRKEDDLSVLQTAARWSSRNCHFTDRLLDAWCDRSLEDLMINASPYKRAVRETALQVIVQATLPSGTSPGQVDGKTWNEERRAGVILKHLSQSLCMEEIMKTLEILAHWKPSPELHGKKVLSEIFGEWEKHMQNIANILEKTGGGKTEMGEILRIYGPGISESQFIRQKYLRETWKGLKTLSPYCAGASDRLLFWMEYWLERGNRVAWEVKESMAEWDPPDASQRERAAVLWSRHLLSADGYRNLSVWKAVGRYVAECRTPGGGMKEICHNCLTALGLVKKIRDRSKNQVLEVIVCPPWLTKRQQAEWEALWVNLMQSSSENMVRVAAGHLLGLVTAGLADWNAVKGTILETLNKNLLKTPGEVGNAPVVQVTCGLLGAIGQWERERNSPGEILYEVCVQLRQSPWWEVAKVRRVLIKELAACLRSNPAQGKAGPELAALWSEILRGERDAKVIASLRLEQSEIMKVCPDFCPASVEVWKELIRDPNPEIRKDAWQFFFSLEDRLEDETGRLLLGMLAEEKSLYVLNVMAWWKPSPGRPLPAGFGEKWAKCLKGIITDIGQSFTPGQGNPFYMERERENIIRITRAIVKTFLTTWLEEHAGLNGQSAKLEDLKTFWETVTEAMNSSPWGKNDRDVEKMQKHMKALFQLEASPEEFLESFAEVAKDEVYDENKRMWRNLLGTVENLEVKSLPVNVRHNLGVVAVSLLRTDMWEYLKDRVGRSFVKLGGDGTWDPGRVPVGWVEFCHELNRICAKNGGVTITGQSEMKRVCAMIGIGSAMENQRFHRVFSQTLFQTMESVKPGLAAVVENATWREVIGASELAEQAAREGKELDGAGQRRWLREFLRSYEQIFREISENKGTFSWGNCFWGELSAILFSRETAERRDGTRRKIQTLNGQAAVFVHPHRSENCQTAASGELVETKRIRQQERQLFLL